jgi:hypothetical protein
MSSLVFVRDCETLTDLIGWVQGQIPNALIVETEGEIVIQTRLTTSMGGYLHPLNEEDE